MKLNGRWGNPGTGVWDFETFFSYAYLIHFLGWVFATVFSTEPCPTESNLMPP